MENNLKDHYEERIAFHSRMLLHYLEETSTGMTTNSYSIAGSSDNKDLH